MFKIDINADASVVFANKLEKIHRAALPNAVRQTLNSAAFDVKTKTMPATVESTFTQRRKNFFKAKSKVEKASGWNVNTMQSMIGFIDGEKNQAVEDLEKQERGGKIDGRTFIPLKAARIGNSLSKQVRAENRPLKENIRPIDRIRNKKEFHRIAHRAGQGGHVEYKGIIFKIKSLQKRGWVKMIPIFSFQKGRSVQVSATHFMKRSSIKSSSKMEKFFKIEAKKQIKRFIK